MKKERQGVPDHDAFPEGDPEHLILAQTKPLPNLLDVGLVPQQDRAGLLVVGLLFVTNESLALR